MISEIQVRDFMSELEKFVDNNFIIEDVCETCGDNSYIAPDTWRKEEEYKEKNKQFLLKIKGILKLNTLKGFLND